METNHQTLCLNMIVKDEAPVIARCLASARPIIDYWVIVDTGSTDGTQDAIRTVMADVPGELREHPWRDFAHNRNEALELARPHGEYVLIIDADDVLEFKPEFKMPALQADSYMLQIAEGSTIRNSTQIARAALPWRWRGVLHDFLTCDDARTSSGALEGLRLRVNHDGARGRNPQTYGRDAELLCTVLQTEGDPFMQSRYQFYLAQSYRNCGENEKALQAYLKRAELGFGVDEVFMSLCSAAKLQQALGRPFDEVMATYLRAADVAPSRAEALHGASLYCRLRKQHTAGYEIAKRAGSFREAPDGLFVEPWIYEYGLLDEFAVNAYWAGAYSDSLDACERILRERKCPEAQRPRIEGNAGAARSQLRTCGSQVAFSDHDKIYEDFLKRMGDLSGGDVAATDHWKRRCKEIENDALQGNRFDFLRWKSLGDLNPPDNWIPPKNYDTLRDQPDWHTKWFPLTRETKVGNPKDFSRDFGTSPALVQHAYNILRYERSTNRSLLDCDVIFEFGGGFGSFCRLLRNMGFDGIHIIYDLPHVANVQRLYLRLSGGYNEIPATDLAVRGLHTVCITSGDDDLRKLFAFLVAANLRVGFVATWSLSEAPIAVRDSIFPKFHRLCSHYLIAYTPTWYEIDNIAYFRTFPLSRPDLTWTSEEHSHPYQPSFYLFA